MLTEDKQVLVNKIKNGFGTKIPPNSHRFFVAFIYGVCLGFLFTLILMFTGNKDVGLSPVVESSDQRIMAHVPQKMNVADFLFIEVKILCVVMLDNLIEREKKITYLHLSWVKRCNQVIYVLISKDKIEDSKLETGRDGIKIIVFPNMIDLFHEIQKSKDFDGIDWILQAPESSYIVLENLRHMLYPFEASWPIFLAHNSTIKDKNLHQAHVFSKASILKINENCSDQSKLYECMNSQFVRFIDTKDSDNRETFFLKDPEKAIFPANSPTFDRNYVETCCSNYLIALHEVHGVTLFKYDYYIYRVYAFGVVKKSSFQLPDKYIDKLNVIPDKLE